MKLYFYHVMIRVTDVDGMANSVDTDKTLMRTRGYKNNSCSILLNMNFFLLINVKMPKTREKKHSRRI